MVFAAAQLGWTALALTDLNGVYGAVWFHQFCKDAGIGPILGAEVRDEGADETGGDRAVVLARGHAGWASLCRLLTSRHLDAGFAAREAILANREGLCALTDRPDMALHLKEGGMDPYLLVHPRSVHRAGRIARRLGLKPLAANPVYYRTREDRDLHVLLRAMELKTSVSRVEPSQLAPDPAWMPSPTEFRSWYAALPEALWNLDEISERSVMDAPPWGDVVLFDFERVSGEDAFSALCRKVKAGAARRYGRLTPRVRERLGKELRLIRDRGFSSYFLIIEDVTRRFPITCGRGSAAASAVAYCLFITHVDPVRHDLMFERFLSMGRKDPPDIDVDFPWDERDGVLDYVFDKYGPERSAMVCNHLTFKSKAAVREVARALGVPEPETSVVTKRMRGYFNALAPVEELRRDARFRGLHFDPPWDGIVETALRLTGVPFGLSTHCGGVVIAENLKDRVPLQRASKGVRLIQWEKDQTEDAGLIKMDLLGNRSLAVIRDGLAQVNRKEGKSGGPDETVYSALDPLNDRATMARIASGRTMGVFYIESPATRQLQEKAKRGDFEHVVIHSSIIRPAAHRFINAYVERLHGAAWDPIHPRLSELLSETYGIMVYQEDVMKVAVELGGFTVEEGSELRKVISKKHKRKRLMELREKFSSGAAARGLTPDMVGRIWDMIMSFSGYSFCKPHSASYALVSFKSAWLKTYHPAEFMAAVISNQGGYYSAFAYLSEARRMGLKVLLPDVNKSKEAYVPEGRAIRIGLMQIKGLSRKLMERVVEERERAGDYESFQDFLHRLDPDPEGARLMVKAGCFDALAGREKRAETMWVLNAWSRSRRGAQMGLFRPELRPPRNAGVLPERTLLAQEREALGLLASRHPLVFYKESAAGLPLTPARLMRGKVGKRTMMIGWALTSKLAITREGDAMEFVSFEDESDIYESVFFPAAYERYCHLLRRDRAFLLIGEVMEDHGAVALRVDSIKPLPASSDLSSREVATRRPGRQKPGSFCGQRPVT